MSQTKLSIILDFVPDSPLVPLSPLSEVAYTIPEKRKLEEYQELRKKYESEGVSNTRQLLLRKLAFRSFLRSKTTISKSKYLFNWVADILMMTELELLYWGNLIARTGNSDRMMNPRCILLLTGYLAKLGLAEDIDPFLNYLLSRFPSFDRDFEGWTLITDCYFDCSTDEVNLLYRKLINRKRKDYEDLVSSVLKRANNRDAEKSDTSTIGEKNLTQEDYSFLASII